ncbi:hypothetical protein [Pseudomonas pudica]|uniref:Transposase n=1 Tax=Pseudomonas pudica TaxID=272772 RepID=A0ABS0FUY0_9PSED|nr:hypothetical protein [Pseudomonas pudica]MBF8644069.1 hypothetical protein [Pseudomonas pudica]MBF8758564.1 hypothetical protein [Pseudomonas pudica]
MNGSDLKIGEHFRRRGQRFQVMSVRQAKVQERATHGPRVVPRQAVEILPRAMKRRDLVKIRETAPMVDPQKVLPGLPRRYLLGFHLRLHYVQVLMARLHGHMPKDCGSLQISELAKRINNSAINRILLKNEVFERKVADRRSKNALKHHGCSRQRPRISRMFGVVKAQTQQLDVLVVEENGRIIGPPSLTAFTDVSTQTLIAWTIRMGPPIRLDNSFGGVREPYVIDSGAEFSWDYQGRIIGMLGREVG